MSTIPLVSACRLDELVSFAQAVDALAAAFAAAHASPPPRTSVPVPGGELLLMPAHGPEGIGVKLVTLSPGNPGAGRPLVQGMYVLFSADGLTPELLIDGAALTGLRTAAVSALATDRLARGDARRLVVFGSGRQAWAHVAAMCAVRPICSVRVVGRHAGRAHSLVERIRRELELDAEVALPGAIASADIVCACTTSPDPVFADRELAPGAHINAVGAYRPDAREVPPETVARALVAVESVEAALAEAGDLIQAIDAGVVGASCIAGDLGDLAAGRLRRRDPGQITLFKSVGLASEDLVLARAISDRLREARPELEPGPPTSRGCGRGARA